MTVNETKEWKKLSQPGHTKYDDTSISWDYESRTVEIFTNRHSVYKRCLSRCGKPIRNVCDHEARVYRLFYPFDQIRNPESILKTSRTVEV